MQGMAQSLNVSVATALLLYEAERQLSEKSYYSEAQLSQESLLKIKEEWLYRDVISRRSKGRIS
jgi:tRNA (guanosine-2'-O-)-methyltransferase